MNEQKLTETEMTLMEILWQKEKVFMKDILEDYADPKPASTTIATLLKRMQNKDLVGYKLFGNSRQYFPKVKKEEDDKAIFNIKYDLYLPMLEKYIVDDISEWKNTEKV